MAWFILASIIDSALSSELSTTALIWTVTNWDLHFPIGSWKQASYNLQCSFCSLPKHNTPFGLAFLANFSFSPRKSRVLSCACTQTSKTQQLLGLLFHSSLLGKSQSTVSLCSCHKFWFGLFFLFLFFWIFSCFMLQH